MANPQKNKGDRFERAAVEYLKGVCPELLVTHPGRELGAGRKDDRGDLNAFPDVSVQVKAHNDTSGAIWQAVGDAQRQAVNRDVPHHLGMVPVLHARSATVNWLFCTLHWPVAIDETEALVTGMPSVAIRRVRDDKLGIPRRLRIAVVRRSSTPDIWIGPAEAWLHAYRATRESLAAA